MLIIAYFVVFIIGLVACFNEAKTAWTTRKTDGLTVFEKRAYIAKASVALIIAFAGIGGLLQGIISSGVLG